MTADFDLLYDAAREGLLRGDRGIAAKLFREYTATAESLSATTRYFAAQEAKRKARKMGLLLAEHPSGPTETMAGPSPYAMAQKKRRRRDPLAYLSLGPHQQIAAKEIRAILEAMPNGAHVPPLDRVVVDDQPRVFDPVADLPNRLREAWEKRYRPWAAKCLDKPLVMAVVVERVSLRDLQQRDVEVEKLELSEEEKERVRELLGTDRRALKRRLRAALQCY